MNTILLSFYWRAFKILTYALFPKSSYWLSTSIAFLREQGLPPTMDWENCSKVSLDLLRLMLNPSLVIAVYSFKATVMSLTLSTFLDTFLPLTLVSCWKYSCYVRSGKLNGSTSLKNDNMCYVSFRIWKQECVPWCGEIQNQRSEVLGKTFNLHSNSTWCPRCVVSQSVSK